MPVDLSDLTLGEAEVLEDSMNMSLAEIAGLMGRKDETGKAIDPPAKLAVCLAWLVKHRADPRFTMADARNMRATELASLFEDEPTRAVEAVRDPTAAPVAIA